MTKKNGGDLTYKKISDDAKFREQYRFVFSGAVVAAVFVVPDGDALMTFLKWVLTASALLSALYLVLTAAAVKYSEPRVIYQVFAASERFRKRVFDWSIDVFGAALLFLASVLVVGLLQLAVGVTFSGVWLWAAVIVAMIIVGVAVIVINIKFMKRSNESRDSELPLI